jgi:hypothetical protein
LSWRAGTQDVADVTRDVADGTEGWPRVLDQTSSDSERERGDDGCGLRPD